MPLPEKHQKTIAKIVEIIKNTVGADLVSIIIFGSFVRGEFTEKSDYDVLIVISDYEDVKSRGFAFYNLHFVITLYYVTVVCSNTSPVCV